MWVSPDHKHEDVNGIVVSAASSINSCRMLSEPWCSEHMLRRFGFVSGESCCINGCDDCRMHSWLESEEGAHAQFIGRCE